MARAAPRKVGGLTNCFLYLPPISEISMANHKSAIKRVRQNAARRERNRYQHKTTRNAVRALRAATDKNEAQEMLPNVHRMLDKLGKRNIIHRNKVANLKRSLQKHVAAM